MSGLKCSECCEWHQAKAGMPLGHRVRKPLEEMYSARSPVLHQSPRNNTQANHCAILWDETISRNNTEYLAHTSSWSPHEEKSCNASPSLASPCPAPRALFLFRGEISVGLLALARTGGDVFGGQLTLP
ncbi:uncharacterized [Tachysurus ichikawai]